MDAVKVTGIIAVIFSLGISCIGLPRQAWINYRRRSCHGLSLLSFCTVAGAYSSWLIYGCLKPDWFLIVSQAPGLLLTLLILIQFRLYRMRPQPHKKGGRHDH